MHHHVPSTINGENSIEENVTKITKYQKKTRINLFYIKRVWCRSSMSISYMSIWKKK